MKPSLNRNLTAGKINQTNIFEISEMVLTPGFSDTVVEVVSLLYLLHISWRKKEKRCADWSVWKKETVAFKVLRWEPCRPVTERFFHLPVKLV